MDIDQLTQMVTWLDEEHRRERGEVAKLQQRIESQATEIVEQARRVQELEGQLASTQAQLVRFNQVDQALQQLKNELVLMLQRQDEQHAKDLRESERLRAGEREAAARNIAEVRKELPRFSRIEEELQQRKVEDQRLTEIVLALRQQLNGINKDIDERTRTLPFLMEQRTQDNKRIAQLQQETVELFKRTEGSSGKLQLLESNQQRIERGLTTIQPIPAQIREEVTTFVEGEKLKDAERDRQMVRWHEEMEQQRIGIEQHHKKLQDFETQIADVKRVAISLQGFEESIRREQHQVAELQRLAEERQRKELDVFVAEDEKRWKKQILEWDGRWVEQQKVNKDLAV
ncbi:MAG: hypothetical protein KDH86_14020, partial [Anaerolineae bacterium]|nr:hypothetical protein [Anaerolineae bacterium]